MNNTSSDSHRPRVRVLLSLEKPDLETRFVSQIVTFAPVEESIIYFSWKQALVGKWDVFHVHWPEFLLRANSIPGRLARAILFAAFMLRVELFRLPIVRTVHNLEPHSKGGRVERLLLAWMDRCTTLRITLSGATPIKAGQESITIPHGHYVERFAKIRKFTSEPRRLLYFGRIEPYKCVDLLLSAFEDTQLHDVSLRIIGKPTPELRSLIEATARKDPRITAVLDFVADSLMVEEVSKASLIVLPYREMHNSGIMLVALSLGRPVLAPRSPTNELIAREVGEGWLYLFDGLIGPETIDATVREVERTRRAELPPMPSRDWRSVAEKHYRAYVLAAEMKSGTPLAS